MAASRPARRFLGGDVLVAGLASPQNVAEGSLTSLLAVLWSTGGAAVGIAWFLGVFDGGGKTGVLALWVAALLMGSVLVLLRRRALTVRAGITLTLLGAAVIALATWWADPLGAATLSALNVYVACFAFVALRPYAVRIVIVAAAMHLAAMLATGFPETVGIWVLTWVAALLTGLLAGAAVQRLRDSVARLRDVDDHKTRFIATVSHELRTPLTAILGFTETLERRWDELDDRERRRFIDVIDRQARRQLRLVNDVLVMTGMMSGTSTPVPEVVDLQAMLGLARESLRFAVEADVPPGVRVRADPEHLQQILENLLVNANRYGAPPIVVRARDDGHTVHVDVVDHGRGIEGGFNGGLLEPFVQGDSGDARVSRGVGLGLAICRDLLVANGGSLEYLDTPGGGSTIRVRLPRA